MPLCRCLLKPYKSVSAGSGSGESSDESDSESSHGDEDGKRRGWVKIIGDTVDLDDDNAVVVAVFPRGLGYGGDDHPSAVDPCALVEDPWGKAASIFLFPNALDVGFEEFPDREVEGLQVSQHVFQKAVRRKAVQVICSLGCQISSFESIDGDETYLKIGLDAHGEAIRHMAACYRYRLPLTREAYGELKCDVAGFPAGRPPVNSEGAEVYAYHEYSDRLKDKLQPFRDVDVIRLLMRSLNDTLDLGEMEKHKVISKYFPAAKHERVLELDLKWVRPACCKCKGSCLCPGEPGDVVREYFGEGVTVFFMYYSFYVRMLCYLAVVAFTLGALGSRLRLSPGITSYVKLAFATFLTMWTMAVQVLFSDKLARAKQCWGMTSYQTTTEVPLPGYRPELDGTRRQAFRRFLSYVIVAACCFLFFGVWGSIAVKCTPGMEAILTSLLIRVTSLLWGNVVPYLAKLHNHRTQRRRMKTMIVQLALFKLFLYLSPFLRTAFLVNWTQMSCAPSLDVAADLAFNGTGWPTGVQRRDHPHWLEPYIVPEWAKDIKGEAADTACIWGCKPAICDHRWNPFERNPKKRKKILCRTDCFLALRKSLDALYVSHVAFTILFLLIAIGLSMWRVRSERAAATEENASYTFLQFQAKCNEVCNYQYLSWGGSFVEDFLELILGFALLSCFGMVRPFVVVFIVLAQALEYRLLAFRMTHVTARPYPAGSSGIEMWERIIGIICMLSVLINAGLAVLLLPAFSKWSVRWKMLFFFSYSLSMLVCRLIFEAMNRGRPRDVSRIEDFNLEAVAKIARERGNFVKRQSLVEVLGDVDVSLEGPENSPGSRQRSKMDVTHKSWRLTSLSVLDNL